MTICLVGLALATAGCGAPSPSLAPLAENATLLAFGDSLTHGTGAAPENSYPAELSRLIDRKVVNAGVPGDTTGEARGRLADALDAARPALVLLCLGGNDFLRNEPEQRVRSNLSAMIERIQRHDIEVVLIEVPKPKIFLRAPDLYRELAAEHGVPLVRDVVVDVLSRAELRSDRIHPNAEGYARIARAVAATLRETGAISD